MLTKFILSLKHWQLFLLFVVPCILPFNGLWALFINMLCYMLYCFWMYGIGITMHALIPTQLKPPIIYYRISFFINLFMVITIPIINSLDEQEAYPVWILIAVFLCSIFYTFYFSAKMLESVIEGEIVSFSDSIKGFICFWFFPLGLWYIQPAVQRVLGKYGVKT